MTTQECLNVLNCLRNSEFPVGATYLGSKLNVPQARVGRILWALEQKGYLSKISNKGRIITPKGLQYLAEQEQRTEKLASAQFIIETAESSSYRQLHEILEIRLYLEVLSVRQACIRSSPEFIQQLTAIAEEQKSSLECGSLGSEQDLQFHLKIAEMSNNETLVHTLKLLLTHKNAYTRFSMVAPHIIGQQIKQHINIIEAIQSKDTAAAQKAMECHLNQVIADVQNYYTQKACLT